MPVELQNPSPDRKEAFKLISEVWVKHVKVSRNKLVMIAARLELIFNKLIVKDSTTGTIENAIGVKPGFKGYLVGLDALWEYLIVSLDLCSLRMQILRRRSSDFRSPFTRSPRATTSSFTSYYLSSYLTLVHLRS